MDTSVAQSLSAPPSASAANISPPIFIGGAGRSGTSLLRTLLNAHSHIHIDVELKATPAIARFWREMTKYAPHLSRYFDLDERDLNNAFGQFITSLLRKKWQQSGKARFGEKTPNNIFVFPHLHQIFPASPLLHIIRDGRDVVRSLLKQNWANQDGEPLAITRDPKAAAAYWAKAVTAGRRAVQNSPTLAERYLEIRYEELVSEPEQTVRSILAHVEEPWEPEILEFHKQESAVYEQVYRPISDSSVGRWRKDLTPNQRTAVKQVAGDLLIELGYADDLNW